MNPINCTAPSCLKSFPTAKLLKKHIQNAHAKSFDLILPGNIKIVVKKDKHGFMKCPLGHRIKSKKTLLKHSECFIEKHPQSTSINVVEVQQSTDPQLRKYGLLFHEEYQFLSCLTCKSVLRGGVEAHLKSKHRNLRLSSCDMDYIRSRYLQGTCNYTGRPTETLPSIHFLAVYEGYQCHTCKHCCKEEKQIRKHVLNNANCSGSAFVPCSVQTICSGNRKLFFRVAENSSLDDSREVNIQRKNLFVLYTFFLFF